MSVIIDSGTDAYCYSYSFSVGINNAILWQLEAYDRVLIQCSCTRILSAKVFGVLDVHVVTCNYISNYISIPCAKSHLNEHFYNNSIDIFYGFEDFVIFFLIFPISSIHWQILSPKKNHQKNCLLVHHLLQCYF